MGLRTIEETPPAAVRPRVSGSAQGAGLPRETMVSVHEADHSVDRRGVASVGTAAICRKGIPSPRYWAGRVSSAAPVSPGERQELGGRSGAPSTVTPPADPRAMPVADLTACCAPITGGVLRLEVVERLARVLKALAQPTRLRLVSLIAAHQGRRRVCGVARQIGSGLSPGTAVSWGIGGS